MKVLFAAFLVFIGFIAALVIAWMVLFDDRPVPTAAISGTVVDAASGRGLPGVEVASEEDGEWGYRLTERKHTDRAGAFHLGFVDTATGTLVVRPRDHAEARIPQAHSGVVVRTETLPPDAANVRSGCLHSMPGRTTNRYRFPVDPAPTPFAVESDTTGAPADLVITLRPDSSYAIEAAGLAFLPGSPGTDLFPVTCTAPTAGYRPALVLPRGADGMLFVRMANPERYAKVRVERGIPFRVWYNPAGSGLCSKRQSCEGDEED
jgi:hypothetical protein